MNIYGKMKTHSVGGRGGVKTSRLAESPSQLGTSCCCAQHPCFTTVKPCDMGSLVPILRGMSRLAGEGSAPDTRRAESLD